MRLSTRLPSGGERISLVLESGEEIRLYNNTEVDLFLLVDYNAEHQQLNLSIKEFKAEVKRDE